MQVLNANSNSAQRREFRRGEVEAIGARQGGCVSRAQLYAHGFSRGEVRANVRARRWFPMGRHVLRIGLNLKNIGSFLDFTGRVGN